MNSQAVVKQLIQRPLLRTMTVCQETPFPSPVTVFYLFIIIIVIFNWILLPMLGNVNQGLRKPRALGTMNESHQLVCTQFHEGQCLVEVHPKDSSPGRDRAEGKLLTKKNKLVP